MTTATLTKEQKAFLEECNLEFSDRFTDADLEYKKVYSEGIPPPPIMYPWYGRNSRPGPNRNNSRASGSKYDDDRNDRDRSYRNRGYRDRRGDNRQDRYSDRNSRDNRYRPY